jgi:hypothetical protein
VDISSHPGQPGPAGGESDAQRSDRNLGELLQELRVAGVGVQVLFGFLLSLPFTNRFSQLAGWQRDVYLVSLTLTVVATALLMAPVAYHRLLFHQGKRPTVVRAANAMALAGMAAVSVAICTAVVVVASFVASPVAGIVLAALLGCVFAVFWLVLPLSRRERGGQGSAN